MNIFRLFWNHQGKKQIVELAMVDYAFRDNEDGPLSEPGKILSGYEWDMQIK